MVKTLLFIRFKQFIRTLDEIGIVLLILLTIVLIPLLAGGISHLLNADPIWVTVLVIAGLTSIHINRKDKAFLNHLSDKSYWMIFAEYVILSHPAFIYLGFNLAFTPVAILIPVLIVLPMIDLTITFRRVRDRPLFKLPSYFLRSFDWISGLRANWIYILMCYAGGLAYSSFTIAAPLSLFFMSLITCSFYQEGESRMMLEASRENPQRFIFNKIAFHLITFWVGTAPITLLFFIFQLQYWYIFLVVMIIVSIFPVLAILLKYSSYQPDKRLDQNNIILAVMIGFLCFPFTQPVPLVMAFVYYRKAIRTLKLYL